MTSSLHRYTWFSKTEVMDDKNRTRTSPRKGSDLEQRSEIARAAAAARWKKG
jgi:hypothetical protein